MSSGNDLGRPGGVRRAREQRASYVTAKCNYSVTPGSTGPVHPRRQGARHDDPAHPARPRRPRRSRAGPGAAAGGAQRRPGAGQLLALLLVGLLALPLLPLIGLLIGWIRLRDRLRPR